MAGVSVETTRIALTGRPTMISSGLMEPANVRGCGALGISMETACSAVPSLEIFLTSLGVEFPRAAFTFAWSPAETLISNSDTPASMPACWTSTWSPATPLASSKRLSPVSISSVVPAATDVTMIVSESAPVLISMMPPSPPSVRTVSVSSPRPKFPLTFAKASSTVSESNPSPVLMFTGIAFSDVV